MLGAAIFGFSWQPRIFCLVLVAAIGLKALPRWRDPKHGPRMGAAVLYTGAAVFLIGALALWQ